MTAGILDAQRPATCSTSTTRRCATAPSRRASTSPSPTSWRSRGTSTSSASASSRAAGRARTPRTPSSSAARRERAGPAARDAGGVRCDPPGGRRGGRRPAGARRCATPGAGVVTLVAKSHDRHVERALRTTLEENLAMIARHRRVPARRGPPGVPRRRALLRRLPRQPRLRARGAARRRRGRRRGGRAVRHQRRDAAGWVADVVDDVRRDRPACGVGIHCHNDTGCAVANTLAAVDAGATHVQGTLNGYGERTGNADLVTVVANLELKLGTPVLPDGLLREATRIAHAIAEVTNFPPASRQPYVGVSAFAHKAGLHASAIKVDPNLYQHIDPGASATTCGCWSPTWPVARAIELKGARARLRPRRRPRARRPASSTGSRTCEARGLHVRGRRRVVRAAAASRRSTGARPSYFDVESWRVITETPAPATRRCPRRR